MSLWQRVREYFGFSTRTEHSDSPLVPPTRSQLVSTDRAFSISTVYRAIEILANAGSQLSFDVWRGETQVDMPSIIKRPNLTLSRRAFVKQLITSLAAHGNAYVRKVRGPVGVVELRLLPAELVTVTTDEQGRIVYSHGGTKYSADDIHHLQLMRRSGQLTGLGPIQAARVELAGALDARDYGAQWFSNSGVPNGILSSDQALNSDQALIYKRMWHGLAPETGERLAAAEGLHMVKVLGQGPHYEPALIKPADAQFLETQQFSTTQIARLFGMPASLMLAAVEGNSQSYSNVEQDWIGFARFTLMGYISEIEDLFESLLPHTQTCRANFDALLRTDTLTRYQAHAIGAGRWLTVDEVRSIEGLPPLTPAARAELTAAAPTPVQEPTNV